MNFVLNQSLVLWTKANALNENGENTFDAPVTLENVRIEKKFVRVTSIQGQERIGVAMIYSSSESLKIGDKVSFDIALVDAPSVPYSSPLIRTIAESQSSPCVNGNQTLYKFIAE